MNGADRHPETHSAFPVCRCGFSILENVGCVLVLVELNGGLAEWSNAPHSKCGWGEIPSQVRILYPPQ